MSPNNFTTVNHLIDQNQYPIPKALIRINRTWGIVKHPNGEKLDMVIENYPYWTYISILRINKLNEQNGKYRSIQWD